MSDNLKNSHVYQKEQGFSNFRTHVPLPLQKQSCLNEKEENPIGQRYICEEPNI